MGKVWELALDRRKLRDAPRTYDLVIVDAPATGHGVALLRTPGSFKELAGGGPMARQAGLIESTLRDHEFTGVAIVAAGEEMAVNESLALASALGDDFAIDEVLFNGMYPQRFSAAELEALERAREDSSDGRAGGALAVALAEARRAAAQREQISRLRDLAGGAVTELPFLFASRIGIGGARRAGGGGRMSESVAKLLAGALDLRLRGLRRGRQDHDRRRGRDGHGDPGQARRRADDRSGEAARRLAGSRRARQRGAPGGPLGAL